MKTIHVTDSSGANCQVPELNFLKAIVAYLREASPDHVKIIAETQNSTGSPETVPVAICMLAKNPEQVMHYTDVLPLEVEPEN